MNHALEYEGIDMSPTKIPADEVFQAWLEANDFVPKYTEGYMQRQMSTLMRYEILDYLETAYNFGLTAGREEQKEIDARIAKVWGCDCSSPKDGVKFRCSEGVAEAIRAQGEEQG